MARAASGAALAGLVATACAGGSGPAPGPAASAAATPSGARALAFAWPEGLRASVELRVRRVRDRGDGPSERSLEGRYGLRTEAHPDGLRVVAEDLRILRMDGRPISGATADPADPMTGFLAPTFVVDAEAGIVEVEGIEAIRRRITERLGDGVPAAQRTAAARLAVQEDRLAEHWRAGVESWVGWEVEPGGRYQIPVDEGSPVLVEVSEPRPCRESDTERRCLELVVTTHEGGKEGAARGEVEMHALTDQLGAPGLPPDLVREFEQSERIEVLTEPERLVPHRIRIRRERRIVMSAEGEAITVSSLDEEEWSFAYED